MDQSWLTGLVLSFTQLPDRLHFQFAELYFGAFRLQCNASL